MYQGGKRARRTLPSPLLSRLLQLLRKSHPQTEFSTVAARTILGVHCIHREHFNTTLTALKFQQQQQRRTMSSGSTSTGLYPSLYLVTICVAQIRSELGN